MSSDQSLKIVVDVHNCPACDAPHMAVEAFRYRAKSHNTHWFLCPTLNEPVGLTLAIGDGEVVNVRQEIIEALLNARRDGRYLVAVMVPSPDRNDTVLMSRFTQNFPTALFPACWTGLRDDLDKEAGPPPVREMPRAGELAPAVNLFAPPRRN